MSKPPNQVRRLDMEGTEAVSNLKAFAIIPQPQPPVSREKVGQGNRRKEASQPEGGHRLNKASQ